MKQKPRYWKFYGYRGRKRDGVAWGEVPDDGNFYRLVSLRAVCFDCRKVFDKPPTGYGCSHCASGYERKCPQCGKPMVNVHPMSRWPRKTNRRGWAKMARAYKRGIDNGR